MSTALLTLRAWPARRWGAAVLAGIITAVLIAVPTAVIPNPVFGRAVEVTWWSYPVVLISGILGGLLIATYVREPGAMGAGDAEEVESADRPMTLGTAGGLVAFFAVGCPVCNKLILLALGTSGAMTWFAPVQPLLALASIALLAWALRTRLRNATSCSIPAGSSAGS